jgi:TolA-binding protein
MKRLLALVAVIFLLATTGCGNFSPRQQPRIDNNQGKINELENMANALKAEILKLQNQSEIQNSQLDRVQQGMANYQSNQHNSGVQIFSGSGGLLVATVGFLTLGIIAFAYRREAKKQAKTADVLADRVVSKDDPELVEQIFQAAMYTDVEENVLSLIQKHQQRSLSLRANSNL